MSVTEEPYFQSASNDSLIKIVDITLGGSSNAPIIDTKVRNIGN